MVAQDEENVNTHILFLPSQPPPNYGRVRIELRLHRTNRLLIQEREDIQYRRTA